MKALLHLNSLASIKHDSTLTKRARCQPSRGGKFLLLIGPEGGWSQRELALVARQATLGERNLRADTAALVALATALASRP